MPERKVDLRGIRGGMTALQREVAARRRNWAIPELAATEDNPEKLREMAGSFEVCKTTLVAWRKKKAIGKIQASKATGRPSNLPYDKEAELTVLYKAGPESAGIKAEKWSAACIVKVVKDKFGILWNTTSAKRFMQKVDAERTLRITVPHAPLTQQQKDELKKIYYAGPIASGYSTDKWNAAHIIKVVAGKFTVTWSTTRAKTFMYEVDPEATQRTTRPPNPPRNINLCGIVAPPTA